MCSGFFYNMKGYGEQQFEKYIANNTVVLYHIGEQQFDKRGESVVVAWSHASELTTPVAD